MSLHGLITGYLVANGWIRLGSGSWARSKRARTGWSLMAAVEEQMRAERRELQERLAETVEASA